MNDELAMIPVIFRNLGGNIHGFCCLGSDYQPIIVINDQLSPMEKRRTYIHELEHIMSGELWDPDYDEYGDAM